MIHFPIQNTLIQHAKVKLPPVVCSGTCSWTQVGVSWCHQCLTMLALLHRSDQPVGVHGRSSEGPVGHEPAKAGHQCHRLGDPKLRHDVVTTSQRVKLKDILVCFVFCPLGFCFAVSAARSQHWYAIDGLQGGVSLCCPQKRHPVVNCVLVPPEVALVSFYCCTFVFCHKMCLSDDVDQFGWNPTGLVALTSRCVWMEDNRSAKIKQLCCKKNIFIYIYI